MPANLKQLFEQFIAPSLQRVEGQLEAIRSEIRRVDDKIDNLDKRVTSQIENLDKRLSNRLDNLEEQLQSLRGEFRLAIDLHERIARLEASLGRQ